jgi:hypothetical protein
MENRLFVRLAVPITIKYAFSNNLTGESRIKNISSEGVCLPFPRNLDISLKTNVTLMLRVPGSKRETAIVGEIAWLRKPNLPVDINYVAGVRFRRVDYFDMEKIIASLKNGTYLQ